MAKSKPGKGSAPTIGKILKLPTCWFGKDLWEIVRQKSQGVLNSAHLECSIKTGCFVFSGPDRHCYSEPPWFSKTGSGPYIQKLAGN